MLERKRREEERNEEATTKKCQGRSREKGGCRMSCVRDVFEDTGRRLIGIKTKQKKGGKEVKNEKKKEIVIITTEDQFHNPNRVFFLYRTSSHVQFLLRLVPLLVGGCLGLVWLFVCGREGFPSLT